VVGATLGEAVLVSGATGFKATYFSHGRPGGTNMFQTTSIKHNADDRRRHMCLSLCPRSVGGLGGVDRLTSHLKESVRRWLGSDEWTGKLAGSDPKKDGEKN